MDARATAPAASRQPGRQRPGGGARGCWPPESRSTPACAANCASVGRVSATRCGAETAGDQQKNLSPPSRTARRRPTPPRGKNTSPETIASVDETWAKTNMTRTRGWRRRGSRSSQGPARPGDVTFSPHCDTTRSPRPSCWMAPSTARPSLPSRADPAHAQARRRCRHGQSWVSQEPRIATPYAPPAQS